MTILNDVEKIRSIDPDNMYNAIFDMPEQLEDALRIGATWKINTDDFIDIKNIVVIGMGGSAIGGDLVRSFLQDKIQVPFQIVRHYTLPEYVDDETLVIVSSYSGNTEETLAALDDAIGRKAMIAGISTGGMLLEVAKLNEIPVAIVPEGLQPRAAIGYSFVPLLKFFEKIGMIKNVDKEIKAVIEHIRYTRNEFFEDSPVDENPAKDIAEQLVGKMILIYSGPTLTDAVGIRWKGQFCENSKNIAFANHYAEFNHNELVGWAEKIKKFTKNMIVIQLRDQKDHPQIQKRMDIVRKFIEEFGVEVIDIDSGPGSDLARMFYLIQLGDFISYYLAVLNETDPSPVDIIHRLKGFLAASSAR